MTLDIAYIYDDIARSWWAVEAYVYFITNDLWELRFWSPEALPGEPGYEDQP